MVFNVWEKICSVISKIQRPSSGGELPHSTGFSSQPIVRRANSAQNMMMDEDVEQASLMSFNDRPRAFPNMRSKTYSPLVSYFLIGCVRSLRFCDVISFSFFDSWL